VKVVSQRKEGKWYYQSMEKHRLPLRLFKDFGSVIGDPSGIATYSVAAFHPAWTAIEN
jgi:hypothetical protein